MKVLFVGDIVGRPGRQLIRELLPSLKEEYQPDLVVANGENAAGGIGLTPATAAELLEAGIDVLTTGNHIWDKKEIMPYLDAEENVLRPANFPPGTPGRGHLIKKLAGGVKIGVVNLAGRVFLPPLDCPFRKAEELIAEIKTQTPITLVDFHAEATAEKLAFAWHFAGKVSAICGTHTHVQTADARVLPGGTAYITDLGMTGPRDGILGMKREQVIFRLLTQLPARFEVAKGPLQLNGVLVEIEAEDGKAKKIIPLVREKEG